MTITAQVPTVTVLANGTATSFNFPFEVPFQDDGSTPAVQVAINGAVIDASLYTIVGVGSETGGHINYPLTGPPLAFGNDVTITRVLAYTQGVAFANDSPPLPKAIETMGDRLEMQIQQLTLDSAAAQGVTSFNGRTGVVSLTDTDVENALGYTPINPNLIGQPNGLATLGNDGILTLAQRPGGGGSFDQTTTFALPGLHNTAPRNLNSYLKDMVSFLDYGAVGDGATDNTAAWNNWVVDVNAGTNRYLYVPPGLYVINGDTTQMTKSVSIVGAGPNLSQFTLTGGTSIWIDISLTGAAHFNEQNFLQGWAVSAPNTGAAYTRQAFRLTYAASTNDLGNNLVMNDVEFGLRLKAHVETVNLINGNFKGVSHIESSTTLTLFAYKTWATSGNFSVGLVWDCVNVNGCAVAFSGTGNLQGYAWNAPIVTFNAVGWDIDVSAGPGGGAPAFTIVGGQSETLTTTGHFTGCAYLFISNFQFYTDGNSNGLIIDKCFGFSLNNLMNVNAGTGTAINVINASQAGKIDNIILNGLPATAFGVNIDATSNGIEVSNVKIVNPNNAGIPYFNANSTLVNNLPTNTRRGQTVVGTFSDAGYWFAQTSAPVAGGVTTSTTPWVTAGPMQVFSGDTLRIQATFQSANPSTGGSTLNCRIREENHKPGTPIPFQIIRFADGENFLDDVRNIASGAGVGAALIQFDSVVTVIAGAPDALFGAEMFISTGTSDMTLVSLSVQRI